MPRASLFLLTLGLPALLSAQAGGTSTPAAETSVQQTIPKTRARQTVQKRLGYLIDMDCQPKQKKGPSGDYTDASLPPSGCGASSGTLRYGLWENGKVLRFDEASNRQVKVFTETNPTLKYAMVHNGADAKPLRVETTGTASGDMLHVQNLRRTK